MCVLYFIVWLLGFIIYIYATSTLVPSGCKSLDDTKDVVLSCSLCQFFFCNCAAQWVYTTGDISNVFEQNSWFLNFFLKNCKKDPIFFCTDFTVLGHCAIQVLVTYQYMEHTTEQGTIQYLFHLLQFYLHKCQLYCKINLLR